MERAAGMTACPVLQAPHRQAVMPCLGSATCSKPAFKATLTVRGQSLWPACLFSPDDHVVQLRPGHAHHSVAWRPDSLACGRSVAAAAVEKDPRPAGLSCGDRSPATTGAAL